MVEVTGHDFADALSVGPAAAKIGAAVLLTDGTVPAAATAAYLAARPSDARYAVGGPAAQADPAAMPTVGADRYATSVAVANRFFTGAQAVGVASGVNYPDGLAGGAVMGRLGCPLLLTTADRLPAVVGGYLSGHTDSIGAAAVFGGSTSVEDQVAQAIQTALDGG